MKLDIRLKVKLLIKERKRIIFEHFGAMMDYRI